MKGKKEQKELRKTEAIRKKQLELAKKLFIPLLKAFGLWFVLVILVNISYKEGSFAFWFISFTTDVVGGTAKLLGMPVKITGFDTLSIYNFPMVIVMECTLYQFYILVVAGALFINWSWKQKLLNSMLLVAILFFFNILRILVIAYIGKFHRPVFDLTHDYFWNPFFAIITLALLLWRTKPLLNNVLLLIENDKKTEST